MKSSLRLPSPVSPKLAPARRINPQIGSRRPASSSPDDGDAAQEATTSTLTSRLRRGFAAAANRPLSSPSSRRPGPIPRAIAPRSSESDSMTASDRRSAGRYGFQGEAFVGNLPPALDDDVERGRAGDEEETRFLDQAALRERGSLVKTILSLVKEGDPVRQLEISEAYWRAQKRSSKAKKRTGKSKPPRNSVVERRGAGRLLADAVASSPPSSTHLGDFDVVVAGGTLGLMLAAALQGRPRSSLSTATATTSGATAESSSSSSSSGGSLRCAVVERGPRVGGGRVQEWNCSRGELEPLAELGILTREELEAVVVTECGPLRVSLLGPEGKDGASSSSSSSSPPLALAGVLDVGVCPVKLMALLRKKFEAAGGVVFESSEFFGAEVFDDGVLVKTRRPRERRRPLQPLERERGSVPLSSCPPAPSSSDETDSGREEETRTLSASLLVDCMGHWSPLVKAARGSQEKPDAVCLVVGACVRLKEDEEEQAEEEEDEAEEEEGKKEKRRSSSGSGSKSRFSLPRSGGEFLASRSHASSSGAPDDDVQWLWEQFPAAGGAARTLYQFAYVDAAAERPSLEASLGRFFADLPGALAADSAGGRRVPLRALQLDRVLFGAFPSYARAPLLPSTDRILHAGDAAGGASPLSFGGFGAMLRHLPRLASGVPEALEASRLSAAAVAAAAAAAGGGGKGSKRAAAAAAAAASSKPLGRGALAALTPYSPSLSTTWLFASAMRLPPGSVESRGGGGGGEEQEEGEQRLHRRGRPRPSSSSSSLSLPSRRRPGAFLPGDHVSRLLAANFKVLSLLGPWALGPFVSERVRFLPLAVTMAAMGVAAPRSVLRVLRQVGPSALAGWAFHAAALAAFALLRVLASPVRGFVFAERSRRRRQQQRQQAGGEATADSSSRAKPLLVRALAARAFAALGRLVDALEYGSGHDGSGRGGGSSSHGVRIVSA